MTGALLVQNITILKYGNIQNNNNTNSEAILENTRNFKSNGDFQWI